MRLLLLLLLTACAAQTHQHHSTVAPGALEEAAERWTETEGELLWLIEEGRFLSFQGTGEAEITMLIELEMVPNDGETFLQSQELTFAGELEVEVTFE